MRGGKKFVAFGLVDQGLSSLITLGLSLEVLRRTNGQSAIEFAMAFVLYSIAIGLVRSMTSEPRAVLYGAPEPGDSVAHALVGLLVGGSVMVLGAWLLHFETSLGWLTVASASLVVAVDAARQTFLAEAQADLAVRMSLCFVLVVAVGICAGEITHDVVYCLLSWGAGGAVSGAVGLWGRTGRFRWSQMRPETFSYIAEYAATSGSTQSALLFAAAVVVPELAVANRVLATAFGPYLVLFQGVAVLAVPLLVREFKKEAEISRGAQKTSLVLAALCLSYGAIAFLMLQGFGPDLFGKSWDNAAGSLPLFTASLLAGSVLAGPLLALRASGQRKASLQFRLVSAGLQLSLGPGGALIAGVQGFFAGSALAQLVAATVGFSIAKRAENPVEVRNGAG